MLATRCVFLVSLAISSWTMGAGCKDKASTEPAPVASGERVTTRGKIVGLSDRELEIHHERIPALRSFDGTIKPMDSMTMSFARSQTSFDGLAVGDAVEIEFTAHYDKAPTLRLARVAKLPAGTALELR